MEDNGALNSGYLKSMFLKRQKDVSVWRGMPIIDKGSGSAVTSVTGETVQLVYNNAGTLTNDAGQAAGTIVVGQLAYDNVKNVIGSMEAILGDTSLSFTSTALTTEVALDQTLMEQLDEATMVNKMAAIGATLSNGQFCVDYASGTIYGKKTTTGATLTSTAYKYKANSSSSTGVITSVVPGTGATNLGKAEDAAHTSGDTGVMALAVANEAQSNFGADGDYTPIAVSRKGDVYTIDIQAPNYEDQTNGVAGTQNKPLAVSTYAWLVDKSAALEASSVTKASAGVFRSMAGRIDSTQTSGTYYIQLLNHASLPSDGAVTLLLAPLKIIHTTGTDSNFNIDCTMNGVYASTGLTWCISTTEFTKTISGAVVSANVLYV